MDRAELVAGAIRVARSFPAVTRGQPFGEGTDVFKVVGKVFAIIDLSEDEDDRRSPSAVSLKCAPPHGRALVAEHPSIIPGYHLNKEHWISLCPGPDIDETLVEDLVGNSYDIIVAALPRHSRPGAAQ